MKILWIPQISSKSNDGKILLNKDSNMSVLRNLLGTDFCNNNSIVIAFEFSSENCIIDEEIKTNFVCLFNESRSFTNAYMERFCFDSSFFESIKEKYNFDLIFINEPTKVIPLRKIFNCKIATYVHWLAFKNMQEIHLRQAEGINAADICFVNSQYTIDELTRFYKHFNICINSNIKVAEPTFSGIVEPTKNKAKYNFIYNHRLSSDIYYMKAFNSLINICDELNKLVEEMPTIYLTNPSGKLISVDRDYLKFIHLETQKEYNVFLSSNNIFCHLNTFFDSEGMWSMSTVDCAIHGNICLLPNKYGYAEIFDENYEGYCKNENDMLVKITKLLSDKNYINKFNQNSVCKHNAKEVGRKMNYEINKI